MKAPIAISAHDRRRIAVHASVDPRTVDRALAGQTIRSTTRARIAEAMAVLGFGELPDQRRAE